MKKDILNLINCPSCEKDKFELDIKQKNSLEIREGVLKCKNCNSKFFIHKGILDLLYKPSATIQKEREAMTEIVIKKERPEKICNDQWLLSLPFPKTMGTNKKILKMMIDVGKNFTNFLEWIKFNGNEKVLDLGAGNCWSTNYVSKKLSKGYCVALDISDIKYSELESADVYIKHNKIFFERVLSNMDKLPFKSDIFDIVFVNNAVHHASSLQNTCYEISRVLKRGGRLILTNEPVISSIKRINKKTYEILNEDREKGFNENIYTLKDYIKSLKRANLKPKIYLRQDIMEEKVNRILGRSVFFKPIQVIWGSIAQNLKKVLFKSIYRELSFFLAVRTNIIAYKI